MPTIAVKRDLLFRYLEKTYTDEEFQKVCFEFGLELDDITTERQMIAREQGDESRSVEGASEEIIYRIDIPANRYDLLCIEGLVLGIKIFQGSLNAPVFRTVGSGINVPLKINVNPSVANVRPYIVGAILRNITFTCDSYMSFIDLQDKLHQNICRKRSLVAIGTHDYDTIQGPFTYEAKAPQDIKFVPLNEAQEYTAEGLMTLYANHAQLKQYLPIIKDQALYPVITDFNGVVLSLPPIINSDNSKITLNTKNVFIECTATDLTKAKIVLDTIVCMFSGYCSDKYSAENVEVCYPDQRALLYPELAYRKKKVSAKRANGVVGIKESEENIIALLSKMSLTCETKEGAIEVTIPPTRHDILHVCDIYEDVAISYGYNKIKKTLPKTNTIGEQLPINKLSDLLRYSIAEAGFTEALTFTLCSKSDISTKLGLKTINDVPAVHISLPKTLEFEVCRTTLLPGILKTVSANRKMPLPIKLFEISDVVIKEARTEVGARNERRICAVNCNKSSGFQIVHGLLDRIMLLLEVPWSQDRTDTGYYIKAAEDPAYLTGMCADIIYNGARIGKIGVIHPTVLEKFEVTNPCAALEFNLEPFL